jgi:hypothetical protein
MTREYNHTVPFDKNYKESINPQLNNDELERLIDLVETNNQYNEDDDDIFFWNVVASKLSLLKV